MFCCWIGVKWTISEHNSLQDDSIQVTRCLISRLFPSGKTFLKHPFIKMLNDLLKRRTQFVNRKRALGPVITLSFTQILSPNWRGNLSNDYNTVFAHFRAKNPDHQSKKKIGKFKEVENHQTCCTFKYKLNVPCIFHGFFRENATLSIS